MASTLINERTGEPLATSLEIAADRSSRRRGLLGRDGLDPSAALALVPCLAVHTAFMRFDLDLVFIDRQGHTVKIRRGVRPWRMAMALGAHAVVEMAAGSAERHGLQIGDRLYVAPASGGADPCIAPGGHTNPPPRGWKRLRDASGTSLVEAALITPLLLLLTLSVVDFGSLFYVYLALENGVSLATRFAVTGGLMDDPLSPGTPLSRVESIKLAMRQATPTLTIADGAFGFSHLPTGGAVWVAGTGGPGDVEKVRIAYTWNLFNPLLWPFFPGGRVDLNVDSAMKNESLP